MVNRQPAVEEMRAALAEADKVAPQERFNRMVRSGLINRLGRLTTLFGGDVDPEPEAIEFVRTLTPRSE